ncbi:MAG: transposase [Victivallaceae bacterium]|nr:transposase [Victivallaceae bacterium]
MKNIEINVSEIKQICKKHGENMDPLWVNIRDEFNLAHFSRSGGVNKRTGVGISSLFETAIAMPLFLVGTVQSFFSSSFRKIVASSQCAYYRFCQDARFNWRRTMFEVSKFIRKRETETALEAKYPSALIIDDSALEKSGRRIEGISKIHDHCTGRKVTGYKLVMLSWFNGNYARTLDDSLTAEAKLKLKKGGQFSKKRCFRSAGKKRINELKKDKITLACELMGRAAKNGYAPDYTLVDSWYTCAQVINKARSLNGGKTHFLGMVKPGKRLFTYNGGEYTLSQLRRALMSEKKRCKRFRSSYIEVVCELKNVGRIKLFFSRFASNKKWVCLLTTDLEMSYIKAIETYAIRWNIEISFKECKQLLGLGKCQANDFDAQIAHATSVFITHSILAYCKYREDYQTLGELYRTIESEYTGLLTVEKILIMLEEILTNIASKMGGLDSVSLHDILNSPEYAAFKQGIRFALFLSQNGNIDKTTNNKELANENMKIAA